MTVFLSVMRVCVCGGGGGGGARGLLGLGFLEIIFIFFLGGLVV